MAINTLSLAAANAALVWMVSPDRSFGAPHKMPWQKFLHGLPNNVFDACVPLPHTARLATAAAWMHLHVVSLRCPALTENHAWSAVMQ